MAVGNLPLGLARNLKLKNDVAKDQTLKDLDRHDTRIGWLRSRARIQSAQ